MAVFVDSRENMLHTGDFPSVQAMEGMYNPGSTIRPHNIQAVFKDRKILPPKIASQILDDIEKCLTKYLMKNGASMEKFGSAMPTYHVAMVKYHLAILTDIRKWQTNCKCAHGPLNVKLREQAAFALCFGTDGKQIPLPLLTNSFVIALGMLFNRILSTITEVSAYS